MRVFWHTVFFLLAPTLAAQAGSVTIQAVPLPATPVVDGMLDEWGKEGWVEIPLKPAMENDPDNTTGQLKVQLKTGISRERIYLAARWPDDEANVEYRPWKWAGSQYKRAKQRDDMFVVRFDMGGDYAECMLSKTDYQVDVWQWSAGRSNQAGVAEDFVQEISTSMVENAAEYEHPQGGMVYIRKIRDAGTPVYENLEAGKEKQENQLPGIKMLDGASGSLVDISAKGVWKDGFWNLELSRKLDTGYNDDVKLIGIKEIKGAIAVFNKGYAEHKSVSETLKFVFP